VLWTPTVVIFDSSGVERFRTEGYNPSQEFWAQLKLGAARVAFTNKRWADAEQLYEDIVTHHPKTASAAEAIYWGGVSHYKASKDHTMLGDIARQLKQKFPDSIWTEKASIWA